jgi:hypothetical protein
VFGDLRADQLNLLGFNSVVETELSMNSARSGRVLVVATDPGDPDPGDRKHNARRLSVDGIERSLDTLSTLLNKIFID